jgi:TetR/AcrR family transcriptional repressor of nem operon
MRYEKGHKDATHARLLQVASEKFRKDGFAASGVAGIMSEVELTNGAFYAHFSSKDDLIEKSLEYANDQQWEQFEKLISSGRLMELVEDYLSPGHRDHPATGCPSATLLPEIWRQQPGARHAYTRGVERLLAALEERLPDASDGPGRRETAMAVISLVIGGLQLARAVDNDPLSVELLQAGIRAAGTLMRLSTTSGE